LAKIGIFRRPDHAAAGQVGGPLADRQRLAGLEVAIPSGFDAFGFDRDSAIGLQRGGVGLLFVGAADRTLFAAAADREQHAFARRAAVAIAGRCRGRFGRRRLLRRCAGGEAGEDADQGVVQQFHLHVGAPH
jgi:hypothetical protein